MLWFLWEFRRVKMIRVVYGMLMMLLVISCESCGPGPSGFTTSRERVSRKSRHLPLVYGQHEPSVSETSFKASGPAQGKIVYGSARFRDLMPVDNPDIYFRNERKSFSLGYRKPNRMIRHKKKLSHRSHISSSRKEVMDRFLTQRCKEKLEILSIMVQNHWSDTGAHLQVTTGYIPQYSKKVKRIMYREAGISESGMNTSRILRRKRQFEERGQAEYPISIEGENELTDYTLDLKRGSPYERLFTGYPSSEKTKHGKAPTDFMFKNLKQALHYEGRAVDIRTSDRDRTKYGMLARLAVMAGFDWVHYESKAHVHCSCRADKEISAESLEELGCFHANSSTVFRKSNNLDVPESIPMKDLKIGDFVLGTDSKGKLIYSQVIAWLDISSSKRTLFYEIRTENGSSLTLTPSHLLFVRSRKSGNVIARYAGDLSVGDTIFSTDQHKVGFLTEMKEQKIVSITKKVATGTLSPLTRHGTIVVNKISVSCYAEIKNAKLAHAVFAPLRWWFDVSSNNTAVREGIHPFAEFLYTVGKYLFPDLAEP